MGSQSARLAVHGFQRAATPYEKHFAVLGFRVNRHIMPGRSFGVRLRRTKSIVLCSIDFRAARDLFGPLAYRLVF